MLAKSTRPQARMPCWNCGLTNLLPDRYGELCCASCGRYSRSAFEPSQADRKRRLLHIMRYFGPDSRFSMTTLGVILGRPDERGSARWSVSCPCCGEEAGCSLGGQLRRDCREWRFVCPNRHRVVAYGPLDGVPERWRLG